MLWIYILLMAASLAGMLWCAKNQKRKQNAQTYAIVCLVVVVISAIGILSETGTFGGNKEVNKIIRNETKYNDAKTIVLAKYLAQKYPDATALVITDERLENDQTMKNTLKLLRENLGTIKIEAEEKIKLPEVNPEESVPMEELLNAERFNEIFSRYGNVKLIINIANLPYNQDEIAKFSVWTMPEPRPKMVLLCGEVYNMFQPIKAGYIAAAIASNASSLDPLQDPPSETQQAFDVRYILVTPENVTDVASKNKDIFMQ